MSRFVRTDERRDVLASLEHCALCLAETKRSEAAWKWVVLAAHGAVQGAMICHLTGTAGLGALSGASVGKWLEWRERDRRGEIDWIEEAPDEFGIPVRLAKAERDQPPQDRVAGATELFRRLISPSARIEGGCGAVLAITGQQRESFERLHALRNSFTHFSPRGWSIEVRFIKDVLLDVLDIIALVADDCWPFRHMTCEERNMLHARIRELQRQVSVIATDVS